MLSKKLKLKTHNKPSFACLASRFPYNSEITKHKLLKVGKAEEYLRQLGFSQVRVRDYGTIARIEIYKKEFRKILSPEITKKASVYFKKIGFKYVTLDIEGYRTGSMNI